MTGTLGGVKGKGNGGVIGNHFAGKLLTLLHYFAELLYYVKEG